MPEGIAQAGAATTRIRNQSDTGFVWPDQVPWSELGEDFIEAWGHDEDGKLRAEHWEIEGQSGSGKSYLAATAMQERAARYGTAIIAILTKQTDDSIPLLGWPQISSFAELRQEKYRQAVFWPATPALGEEREKYHEAVIYELLSNLWPKPGELANVVIYIDEIRYLESLSVRLKKLIRQYWREGRSHGISIIAGAQRPLEMVRDMHSEARWRAVFCPSDEADMERFAELLGPAKDWEPVLRDLDQQQHQFVLRNSFTKDAFITWIDSVLRPLPSQSAEGQKKSGQGDKPAHIYGAPPKRREG
jgi:hypothetical protein